MTLEKMLEILASENKLKIIAHYYNCTCEDSACVGELQEELGLSQSNISKHLSKLKMDGVLEVKVHHKQRLYSLNSKFKKEWELILEPIMNRKEVKQFQCSHCKLK